MKKRGRPPLDPDDPSVKISVTVPSKTFDALCQQAQTQARTLPATIRRILRDGAAPAFSTKK